MPIHPQSTDTAVNPLLATLASSGMGKSTLIDAIAALSFAQIAEMSPATSTPEFHRAVSGSIRVTIDYQRFQPVTNLDLEHPVAMTGLRILHSYVSLAVVLSLPVPRGALFFICLNISFTIFCLLPIERTRYFCTAKSSFALFLWKMGQILDDAELHSLTVEGAVTLIQHHHRHYTAKGAASNPLVFVFVDETRSLTAFNAARDRLKAAPSGAPPFNKGSIFTTARNWRM